MPLTFLLWMPFFLFDYYHSFWKSSFVLLKAIFLKRWNGSLRFFFFVKCVFEFTGDNHIRVVLQVVAFNTNLLKPLFAAWLHSTGTLETFMCSFNKTRQGIPRKREMKKYWWLGLGSFPICTSQQNRIENLPPSRNSWWTQKVCLAELTVQCLLQQLQ